MANIKLDDYVPEVKEALDKALAEHLTLTQGKLAKANPKDTGRMASSWFVSQNKPRTDTRPDDWAPEGAKKVELDKPQKVEFDGTWYVVNNLPYAERVALDPKWAKGGAGGAAWYRNIESQLAAGFGKSATKFLRRI